MLIPAESGGLKGAELDVEVEWGMVGEADKKGGERHTAVGL